MVTEEHEEEEEEEYNRINCCINPSDRRSSIRIIINQRQRVRRD